MKRLHVQNIFKIVVYCMIFKLNHLNLILSVSYESPSCSGRLRVTIRGMHFGKYSTILEKVELTRKNCSSNICVISCPFMRDKQNSDRAQSGWFWLPSIMAIGMAAEAILCRQMQ